MSLRTVILQHFDTVAREQHKQLKVLSDDLALLDSGLDSLCFAIIVVRLEEELGFDPFSTADAARYPINIGQFIRFYEDAAP